MSRNVSGFLTPPRLQRQQSYSPDSPPSVSWSLSPSVSPHHFEKPPLHPHAMRNDFPKQFEKKMKQFLQRCEQLKAYVPKNQQDHQQYLLRKQELAAELQYLKIERSSYISSQGKVSEFPQNTRQLQGHRSFTDLPQREMPVESRRYVTTKKSQIATQAMHTTQYLPIEQPFDQLRQNTSSTKTQHQSHQQPFVFGQPQQQPIAFGQPQQQTIALGRPQQQPIALGQSHQQPITFGRPQQQPIAFGQPHQPIAFCQPQQQPIAFGKSQQQPITFGQPHQQPIAFGQPQQQPIALGQSQQQPIALGQSHQQPIAFGQPHQPIAFCQPQQQPIAFGQPHQQPIAFGQPQQQPIALGQSQQQPITFGQLQQQPIAFGQPQQQPFEFNFSQSQQQQQPQQAPSVVFGQYQPYQIPSATPKQGGFDFGPSQSSSTWSSILVGPAAAVTPPDEQPLTVAERIDFRMAYLDARRQQMERDLAA